MSKETNNVNIISTTGFTGMLTVLFIALKLTDVITWSWWWVLAPIWISMLFWVGILLIVIAVIIVAVLMDK